ncbi:MAG: methyl-accepting chemotaxis protein [Candidatus Desulfofervidaceae bacterium]|nr:methyl-accepting chemotaxis protein [Candidatus Desulfofervidaceae bacterium]MDL1970313.1 methyl-accepting chemotaxis protein [Candidatus Desulfofervidaceae bacterium]
MEKKVKRKKLNYAIKTNMQLRLFLKVFFIVFVSTAASVALFYFYSRQEIGQTYYQVHIRAKTFLDFLWPILGGALAIGLLVGGIIALFFPHTIAGPLYRLEKEIKRIGEGDLTSNFKIRKGDDLQEFVDELNKSIQQLHDKVQKIRKLTEKLKEESKKNPDLAIKSLILELDNLLSQFRL